MIYFLTILIQFEIPKRPKPNWTCDVLIGIWYRIYMYIRLEPKKPFILFVGCGIFNIYQPS